MGNTSVFMGEKLLEAEAEGGLFNIKAGGIYLWQYVRYNCLVKIIEDITGVETKCRAISVLQSKEKMKEPLEWFKHQQFLVQHKDILVLNHPRRVKEGKYYKCFVTDYILQNLDYSYYVYEREYAGLHYKPVRTKNLKYIDLNIIRKIFKYDEERDKKQLSAFAKKIIWVFENYCRIGLSRSLKQFIYSYVFNMHREIYYHRIWAKIILKLVHPKLVMAAVGYNYDVQAVVGAAREMGIPTIELQHARIGATHLAYNYIYKGKIETFADYMFVYGNYDKEVPRYPIGQDHVLAVGYPELERRADYYAKHKKRSRRKVIMFLSAPGPAEIVLKYALELRKSCELKDYRMIYKLHPCEYNDWKDWYPELEKSGLEIISNNLHDIYYYLGHSDYVVGISSTVLFEAIEFHTQIFVIKDGDYRKAEYLYESHHASLIENIDQLISEIRETGEKQQIRRESEYFKRNSIQNIRSEIKKIIGNNK